MNTTWNLNPLRPHDLETLAAYWPAAHPLHPMTPELLQRRILAPPGADPELMIAARDPGGKLIGLACGVYPVKEAGMGGVRWLGVAPEWRAKGIEAALLENICGCLKARGASKARLMATPPYYLRPGVDTRETHFLATLLDLGWQHEATHFNMTVDLKNWEAPDPGAIWDADAEGYEVRRAVAADREAFRRHVLQFWSPTWAAEADQAFDMTPIPLFLAWKDAAIAGFAACEVSQCLGGFGPTGVPPEHRGAGLGKRLLWACLDHLQRAGRERCEIGWIGPVSFYHRTCGATLGPAYWMLSREL